MMVDRHNSLDFRFLIDVMFDEHDGLIDSLLRLKIDKYTIFVVRE